MNIMKSKGNKAILPKFTEKINYNILSLPIFYLSKRNEIKCTIDKFEYQIGPIFPSLLQDEPIVISFQSFIDKKVLISIDDIEKTHDVEIFSNEKAKNRNPIQMYINLPKFQGKKKERIDIKGKLVIKSNEIDQFLLPFEFSIIVLPIKIKLRCHQYSLSEIESNNFKLCCNYINSDETIDFELINYYEPDLFNIISTEIIKDDHNQAESPVVQINESGKIVSITAPHVEEPTFAKFDVVIKLFQILETRIRCDFIIRPHVFIFEMYDYFTRKFTSDVCQVVISNPNSTQLLHFRIIRLYQYKQKAKLMFKLPDFIKIKGSSIEENENNHLDDFEINENLSFYISINSTQFQNITLEEEYSITLEINHIQKTIKLDFIDTSNLFDLYGNDTDEKNNNYLQKFSCYSYIYNEDKWKKIQSNKEIQDNKNSPVPYIIAGPFQSFITLNNFIVINYFKDGFDYVTTSNSTKINYLHISLEDNKIKFFESAQDTEIKSSSFFGKTKVFHYKALIGYIKEYPDNWFPVFDEHPNTDDLELLPYKSTDENFSKANDNLNTINNRVSSSSEKLLKLLIQKNIVSRINDIIRSFPPSLQNKFYNIIDDINFYINFREKISEGIYWILSNNLIISFLRIFGERYRELESHYFCLQMNVHKLIVQKQIDKSFAEFTNFTEETALDVNEDIEKFLEMKNEEIEESLSKVTKLPKKAKRYECMMLNENFNSKNCNRTKEFPRESFDLNFNENSILRHSLKNVDSLPSIDSPIGDSLSCYISFFSSCIEGAILFPAFVRTDFIKSKNFNIAEQYFAELFKIFTEASRTENRSVLSWLINEFINSFKICVKKLKLAGVEFDQKLPQILDNCDFQYNQIISIPNRFQLMKVESNNF